MFRIVTFVMLFLLIGLSGCTKQAVYTVNFDTDGGSFIEAVVIKGENQKVSKPADPVKEGTQFKEWQYKGTAYDFDSIVTEDMTLKAVYEKYNTVTVIVEGETYIKSFKEGETLVLETPTSKEGKTFVGWMVDGKKADLSEAKDGSKIEAIFVNNRIPCTGLKTQYHNYWTIEGTKAWNLELEVSPANTTDVPVYKSDDESIVTVDQKGNVTAQKVGTTKIHITCGDQELTIGFETRAKSVAANKVEVDQDKLVLYNGQSEKIKVTVLPENTTDKSVTFTSSDKSIVKVDDSGNVTGVSPGIAKITVKTANDVSATVDVCVEGEKVIFDMENNVSVKASSGEKIPYTVTHIMCYDWNINKMDVTKEADFHTAYTSALDIDGNGNVYAKGAVFETVDIEVYFTYSDGSSLNAKSDTYIVHVEK